MHRNGLVHRALTPDSIRFESKPEGPSKVLDGVVVSDWELGAVPATDSESRRRYNPPESGGGTNSTHPDEGDVYRLGAITYHVATGTSPPHDRRESDESLDTATIPSPLDEVVEKSMAVHPEDRYSSVLAFRDALQWAVRRIE